MLKFPYGESDFYKIITEGYLYVDRTDRIPLLENFGSQLSFLRPRRFGKSLLLSTLENYYDIARADEFECLFGHLAIGRQPTDLHNQYFVLRWDFSAVSPQGRAQEIQQALHRYLNARIRDFTVRYRELLPGAFDIDATDALISFQSLLTRVQQTPYRLYLLIDEYDNFANEVLMGSLTEGQQRYEELLYSEGALKTVFKAVKSAASGLGLDRVFITGVAPIVLNDMTSGYNVARSLSLETELQSLCGFEEQEISDILLQIVEGCGFSQEKTAEILAFMRTMYNGYCFSYDSSQSVYNPMLAIYFLDHLQRKCETPRKVLDSNLGMDQQKLVFASMLPYGEQVVQDAVNEEHPLNLEELLDGFGVKDLFEPEKDIGFTASLFYFLGVLTLGERHEMGNLILRVPNLVARKLYFERIQRILLPGVDKYVASQAAERFFRTGDLQDVCDFVEQRYFPVFSNRDYRWSNELTVKTAFLTLLFRDTFYVMDSKPEIERGYADLIMIVRPDMRSFQLLDMVLEFKFISLTDAKLTGEQARGMTIEAIKALPAVAEKLTDAARSLQRYRGMLETAYGDKLRLHAYVVLALGFERIVWEER